MSFIDSLPKPPRGRGKYLKCSDCINQNTTIVCKVGTPYICNSYLDQGMIDHLKFKKWIKG